MDAEPPPHTPANDAKSVPRTAKRDQALVSRIRSSRDCSAGTFANFGFKRDTGIIGLLVSLWFGSSLGNKLRIRANFRTATLGSGEFHDHRVDREAVAG